MSAGTITQKGYDWQWQKRSAAVLERDRHICRYCGGYATTVDHIIPKNKGGTDTWDNLAACCRRCNSSKAERATPKPVATPRPRFSRRKLTGIDE